MLALRLSPALGQGGLPCVGDCADDGQVTVDEIILGVSIALGQSDLETCLMFDSTHDGSVTVDEILASVTAALDGCVVEENQAPVTSDLPDYRTYVGQPVAIPLPGSDPDGDTLAFAASGLPEGAVVDEQTGILSWTPESNDIGPYAIEYTVTDDRSPPLSAGGRLLLQVMNANACLALQCDPATGCTAMPLEIETNCCEAPPVERIVDPLEDCPGGARLEIGRNASGFGALQDCDVLPMATMGQGGTTTKMHIAARCINNSRAVSLRVELRTPTVVLVRVTQPNIPFPALENGFAGRRNQTYAIDDSTVPPEEFEGQEAQLVVAVGDVDGVFLERTLRVRLSLASYSDLPDDESSPDRPN